MDHVHAIDTQAVERYLIGELSAAEAGDFELHYFECSECALAVEAGGLLVDNARVVFSRTERPSAPEPKADKSRKSFWNALAASWTRPIAAVPLTAAVVFGVIALYQGTVVIPGMRDAALVLPAFQLVGASRGEGLSVKLPVGTRSFSLAADVPPDAHFPQYICTLSTGGRTVFRLVSQAPVEGQPITLLVPARELSAGVYELSIFGARANGTADARIARYSFDFQVK